MEAIKIMPLGDSLTFGVVNNDTNDNFSGGYRTVLWDSLKSDGFNIDFVGPQDNALNGIRSIDKDNAGMRGWRIDQLLNGRGGQGKVSDWLDSSSPNIVLLMAGTNDFLNGETATQARDELRLVIQTVVNSGAQVLVASIPALNPASSEVTQAAADEVNAFNGLLPGLVAEFSSNVSFVDIAAALDGINDISSDGIHLTSTAYSKVGTVWHNALRPLLNTDSSNIQRGTPVRLEVEDFGSLGVFGTENTPGSTPPPTKVISLLDAFNANGSTPVTATATDTFNLPTGQYDVILGFFDEADSVGNIQVTVGDDSLPEFQLDGIFGDGHSGDSTPTTRNFVRKTVGKNLTINNGDAIEITGTSAFENGGGELIRIDYIEFVPISGAGGTIPNSSEGGSDNSSGNNTSDSSGSDSSGSGFPIAESPVSADDDVIGIVGTLPTRPNFRKGREGDRFRGNGDRNRLKGTGRNDVLLGKGDNDVLRAKGGNDKVKGNDGKDKLFGQGGSDRLVGGDDNDQLKGGSGDDLLQGQDGRDRLIGQGGNDFLIGGDGKDRLTGNGGNDVFVFQKLSDGIDIITDFQPGSDVIDLRRILSRPEFAADTPIAKFEAFVDLSQRGNSTLVQIDLDGNGLGEELEAIAKLKGVNATNLNPTDFVI